MNKTSATFLAALAMGMVMPTVAFAQPPEPTTITKTTVTHKNHKVTRKTVTRHTTCTWKWRHHQKVKVCR